MERVMFGWYCEVDAWSRFWRWNLIEICVKTCAGTYSSSVVAPIAKISKGDLEAMPRVAQKQRNWTPKFAVCVPVPLSLCAPCVHRPLSRLFLDQSAWNFGSKAKIKFSVHSSSLRRSVDEFTTPVGKKKFLGGMSKCSKLYIAHISYQ